MQTTRERKTAQNMALKILFLGVAALAIGYVLFRPSGDVSSTDARQLVAQGARLVDVRTREEFADGHIAGAINIPVQELEQRMGELQSKEQPIVVYCRSGARSARAAGMLRGAGYSVVHDLGAMSRW